MNQNESKLNEDATIGITALAKIVTVIPLETLVEKQLIDAMLSNQTRKIHIDNISINNACWGDNIQSCIFINTEDSYRQSVKDELQTELNLLESYEKHI